MKPQKKRWASLKYRRKIRNVLLTYYLIPILMVLLASGGFFYLTAKQSLDEELGKRLISIAMAAAGQVRGYHVAALGFQDHSSLTYQSLSARFDRILRDNNVEKIYLFTPDNRSLLDTDMDVLPGSSYERNQLNRVEIDRVQRGETSASILFQGNDGRYYKSAFAPVLEGGKVIALVGVDGSATFFQNLQRLGKQLAYFVMICVGIIILVSLILSKKIVTPVRLLVSGAQRIGDGHLEEPIQIETQNEIGFLGFVLDEMRKSIIHRDRELQMMLRGIAHEVRNPLGGIELFAGMLEEEVKDSQGREAIHRIQHEIRTLKSLVEEFLDFARGPLLQVVSVPIEPFLEDFRVAFQKELGSNNIRLNTDVKDVYTVDFDPDQMRRVFLNLIQNAIHAMPSGGILKLGAQDQNGQIELFVTDTGIGIPEENVGKLFDPFFTTKERGTGLGLSFVRKIVNAHGGEVKVRSSREEGTRITVVLPK